MARKSSGKKKTKEQCEDDTEFRKVVMEKEEILRSWLGPREARIMSLQSVLVWENPQHSVALILGVNVLFWLATTLRLFYMVGITGALIVFLDMWWNYIWPEIRVPIPPEDCTESWTPIHPTLISVPEICRYLAEWWAHSETFVSGAIHLRQTSHAKFFIFAMLTLCGLGFFGHCVPGIVLCYLTVMGLLLFPCALYHNIPQLAWEKIVPVLHSIEEKFRIRRLKGKGKKKRGELPQPNDSDADSEVESFVPRKNPSIMTTLEKAVTESEEDDSEYMPGRLTPHMPSTSASREHSDAEGNDDPQNACLSLTSLTENLGDLPSFDDSLDCTSLAQDVSHMPSYDNSLQTSCTDFTYGSASLDPDLEARLQKEMAAALEEAERSGSSGTDSVDESGQGVKSPYPMTFVAGHFKADEEHEFSEEAGDETLGSEVETELHRALERLGSEDDDGLDGDDDVVVAASERNRGDEEELTHGLAFPDVDTETPGEASEGATGAAAVSAAAVAAVGGMAGEARDIFTGGLSMLQSQGQALSETLASKGVTKTVSDLMTSTVAGLSSLREQVSLGSTPPSGAGGLLPRDGPDTPDDDMIASKDTDILEAEFEFLNQEDFVGIDADNDDPENEAS